MKLSTITTLSIALLALSTSCKKSADLVVTPKAQTTASAQKTVPASVTLDFNEGNMITSQISVYDSESRIAVVKGPRIWTFFDPIRNAGLQVPKRSYQNLETTIDFMSMEGNPVLDLRGTMTMSSGGGTMAMTRDFEFAIMRPLSVQASSGAIEVTDGTTMIHLLNLHLDRLIENTTDSMWQLAMNGNSNTILISENSNQQLFHIMLNNLQAMLPVVDPYKAPAETVAIGTNE